MAARITFIVIALILISVKATALTVQEFKRVAENEKQVLWDEHQEQLKHKQTCKNYPFLKVCNEGK